MEGVRERRRVQKAKTMYNQVAIKDEEVQNSKKLTAAEKEKLLYCLKVYGHKDLQKMTEELPGRSREDIRKFLINIHSLARQRSDSKSNMNYWLERSISEMDRSNLEKNNFYYQSAQIMKFLSVDGLLECHPTVENCGGIDFLAAYRLIYQSLMGYPLQPVNQATADFVLECFTEENENKNCDFVTNVMDFLKNKFQKKVNDGVVLEEKSTSSACSETTRAVYGKKKRTNEVPPDKEAQVPALKIFVQESAYVSDNVKCYSLAIGDKDVSTVAVPIGNEKQQNELEETASKLWNNVEFNPLGLPEKWSRIPFH